MGKITTRHNGVLEKRCLTVYSNKTEWFQKEYEFKNFDLAAFQTHFGIFNTDQLMYNQYPVSPEDTEFVSGYLSQIVTFDFDRYSYFVSCYEQNEESEGASTNDGV
jgi:hypothetical protein